MCVQVTAKKELEAELAMRLNVENNVAALVQQTAHSLETLMASIATPVTEDWDCFKSSIEHFNQQCVHLGEYVPPPVGINSFLVVHLILSTHMLAQVRHEVRPRLC
jgi:hypothetical protein